MKKVRKIITKKITLNHTVSFPLEDMKNCSIANRLVFDFRGEIFEGKSEKQFREMLMSTVFSLIPEIMAEYVAICLAISQVNGQASDLLEKRLVDHLNELDELSQSMFEYEQEKQNRPRPNNCEDVKIT